MRELLPGLYHWYAIHPSHGMQVSCHFAAGSGTVFDPLLPDEGIEWFDDHRPERIVLSTRHHLRNSEQIAERFRCPILAHREGLHEFEDGGPGVQGFEFGETLAEDVRALTMDAISPDDTVLRLDAGGGALLFADSVINHGGLGFVPDRLIGDEPERVRALIRERVRALLDEDFDHLMFAHGDPIVGGGEEALRAFAQRP